MARIKLRLSDTVSYVRSKDLGWIGICLAGRELPLDIQAAALSYLTFQELARLLSVSRGWKKSINLGLERLPVVTISTVAEGNFTLRYCKRLVSLRSRPAAEPLMQANAATLRSVTMLSFHKTVPLVPACRNLSLLRVGTVFLDTEQTRQLVTAYPALERIYVLRLDLEVLLRSALPLRSVLVPMSNIDPSTAPLLHAHTRLEDVNLALPYSTTAPDYISLFRAFQALPMLNSLSLFCPSNRTAPVSPTQPPIFGVLRRLTFRAPGCSSAAPIPVFLAPQLTALRAEPCVAWLSGPEVLARFPLLTACSFQGCLFRTPAERTLVAERLRQGVWGGLSRLHVDVDIVPGFLPLVPSLPASLQELALSCTGTTLHPAGVRALLFGLPQLELLTVVGRDVSNPAGPVSPEQKWQELEEQKMEAPQSFEHSRLLRLQLRSWESLKGTMTDLLGGISFPRLQELSMLSVLGAWNLRPVLVRCPALKELTLIECAELEISLPGPDDPPYPRLEEVEIEACPSIAAGDLVGLLDENANVSIIPIYGDG